jgi:hypothetical protein
LKYLRNSFDLIAKNQARFEEMLEFTISNKAIINNLIRNMDQVASPNLAAEQAVHPNGN